MCQRKPGPRCSRDVMTFKTNAMKAYQGYTKTLEPGTAFDDPRAKIFYKKWQQANLNYDATPQGIKDLEERVIHEQDNKDTTTVVYNDQSEDALTVPASAFTGIRLDQAQKHRAWQKQILETLEKIEQEDGGVQAKEFADLIADSCDNDLVKDKKAIAFYDSERTALLEQGKESIQANASAIRAFTLSTAKHVDRMKFTELRIDDLRNYSPRY
jgi:hypothetical protein